MDKLTPNHVAFLGLCNEYCQAVESAAGSTREDFVDTMLRLLPRLYITMRDTARDTARDTVTADTSYLPAALEEDYYDSVRRHMETLLGEHDTYLEVFEEDMKYSDTPIAASISEGLADIFQVLYNLIENVKDAPVEIVLESIATAGEDFRAYWGQTLCNVLRPLNSLAADI